MLEGCPINRTCICCTFSDCITAPRNGVVSGCYPLDKFYKQRPEAAILKEVKSDK
jgi:NADPH2 dehydrogenase